MRGEHKDKEDPTRWIHLRCDYKRDLHRANTGCFFTIRLHREAPPLSKFLPSIYQPMLTPLGVLVEQSIRKIESLHPTVVRLDNTVLMPDHLHLCFFIQEVSRQTPLQLLTSFLVFAQKAAKEQQGIEHLWELPGDLWVCYSG